MGQKARKSDKNAHKFTQNYPSERKNYPLPEPTAKPDSPRRPSSGARDYRYRPVQGNPDEGGKISPDEAERISSDDFPS